MSNRSILALSLAAILFVSGCIAKEEAGKKASDASNVPIIATPADVDESTCGIEGFVGDETFAPIPGADVGIQGTESETKTAQDGRFSFSFVQPGTHTVVVSALGYETQSRRVPCESGQKVADLIFSLRELPKAGVPYQLSLPFKGRIGCSFTMVTSTGDVCAGEVLHTTVPAKADNDAKRIFRYTADAGAVTAVMYELKWQSTSGAFGAQWLEMQVPPLTQSGTSETNPKHIAKKYCPGTEPKGPQRPEHAIGKSRMCVSFTTMNESMPVDRVAAGKDAQVRKIEIQPNTMAHANDPTQIPDVVDKSSKLVVQQNFDVWASMFYHGHPMPENFSMFEG